MTTTFEGAALSQIASAHTEFAELCAKARHDDLSDLTTEEITQTVTRMLGCIYRFTMPGDIYRKRADQYVEAFGNKSNEANGARHVAGVLQALRSDIQAGSLVRAEQLVHADVFDDLLERAAYLMGEGDALPAAVLAGAVLEQQLRAMSVANDLPVANAGGRPLAGGALNDGLAKESVYGKIDHKNVGAWLGVRNAAAHGKTEDFSDAEVTHMLSGVRLFLTKHGA